ncbi:TonB-dependent receptor [Pseudoluteimonas lycopersici]|uniref:TonB-dependent receptor n=1 Tax=Pseudoluteimonas lycopersici TaxID=1324796 RepID=UPI00163DD878|nr:TonB-dependent receptor [Lysobacter lycopersici]
MGNKARNTRQRRTASALARLPLAMGIYLAFGSMAWAQDASTQAPPADAGQPAKDAQGKTLETITVTAQKRTENMQKVPISIQAIGETTLKRQDIQDFDDYAKLIPSLSYSSIGGGVFSGPGFAQVYMRGVASGGDGNHSGSQPSVGMYLDEQPITTIQGSLDINIYDVARIEALAGPQGTLYGASSEAGTVRIITNKPDPSGFAAGYSAEVSATEGGGIGHVVQGFVNAPLSPAAAIRLVGWEKYDAGYVDNIHGTRTFPSSGVTMDNAAFVDENYNWARTAGARIAARFEINDDWSITPQIMGQRQKANGSAGFEPKIGDLQLHHYFPENSDDHWTQAALTVEGKIGNFDLTYAFSHLKRDVDSQADYSDYYWYDQDPIFYGQYFYDDDGNLVPPAQHIDAKDGYTKTSHELRITSPKENRLRFVAGLFWQQQQHEIFQDYLVDGIASSIEVPGWPDTIWLTAQEREDNDKAVFGELSFDLVPGLTATVGGRWFHTENSLKGFFGYGAGFSSGTGEAACFSDVQFHGAPCTNLDKSTSESGSLGRFNLSWQIDDDKMIYATWSEGFRPGGINRRGNLPPYKSDFLTNYEFGWKTTWADNALSWNGAVFQEDWKDFQFSYLGANGLTEIRNAGQAQIRGLETDLRWAATYNLAITGGLAFYDAKLTENYCGWLREDGSSETVCPAGTLNPNGTFDDPSDDFPVDGPQAPKGSRLPVTARFKGNLTARYTTDMWGGEGFAQAALSYQGSRKVDLREDAAATFGDLAAYTLTDLSVGFRRNNWSVDLFLKNAFDKRAELARFAECKIETCGAETYTVVTQPRTFGIRFSQEF